MKITVEKVSDFLCEECGRVVGIGNGEEAVVLHKKDNELEVYHNECCQLPEEVKNLLRVVWWLVPAYEPI